LARAIAVIEEVFGQRIVHGDDGVVQRSLVCHCPQTDDARGGFLCAADDGLQNLAAVLVHRADQVGAIIHGDVGLVVQRSVDVFVVGSVVLTLDGIHGNLVVGDQRRGDIILSAQRVARDQHEIGATSLQHARQVARLCGDVQTCRHAHALERFLGGKALADTAQHRHLTLSPVHAQPSGGRQFHIFYMMFHSCSTPGNNK